MSETRSTVHIVLCHWEGCYECGDGQHTHIVAICTDKETAEKFKISHENEQDALHKPHYGHPYYVDIEEIELNTSQMILPYGYWRG